MLLSSHSEAKLHGSKPSPFYVSHFVWVKFISFSVLYFLIFNIKLLVALVSVELDEN